MFVLIWTSLPPNANCLRAVGRLAARTIRVISRDARCAMIYVQMRCCRDKTYEIVGLLAELGVVLADEGVGCVVLGGLYLDAAALNVKSL